MLTAGATSYTSYGQRKCRRNVSRGIYWSESFTFQTLFQCSGNLFQPYAHRSGVFTRVSLVSATIQSNDILDLLYNTHDSSSFGRRQGSRAHTWCKRYKRTYFMVVHSTNARLIPLSWRLCNVCRKYVQTVNSFAPILLLFIFGKSTARLMMLFSLTISLNKCMCFRAMRHSGNGSIYRFW